MPTPERIQKAKLSADKEMPDAVLAKRFPLPTGEDRQAAIAQLVEDLPVFNRMLVSIAARKFNIPFEELIGPVTIVEYQLIDAYRPETGVPMRAYVTRLLIPRLLDSEFFPEGARARSTDIMDRGTRQQAICRTPEHTRDKTPYYNHDMHEVQPDASHPIGWEQDHEDAESYIEASLAQWLQEIKKNPKLSKLFYEKALIVAEEFRHRVYDKKKMSDCIERCQRDGVCNHTLPYHFGNIRKIVHDKTKRAKLDIRKRRGPKKKLADLDS